MIDCIIGAALRYTKEEIRPFLKSLIWTGYTGRVILFADGEAAEEAAKWIAPSDVRKPPRSKRGGYYIHGNRFSWILDALQDEDMQGVLMADTRDLIFQKNPETLPYDESLHTSAEDTSMTIGSCPYNSKWIETCYGKGELDALRAKPILCVGVSYGSRAAVLDYLEELTKDIKRLLPKTNDPVDQAVHNHICYAEGSTIVRHANEASEVYTVGYIPYNTVAIRSGAIVNRAHHVPSIIHQWDRHPNLKALVEEKYS